MKKLRSRKVFKIPTSYIGSSDYNIEMSLDKARNFKYLISIANNQVFHAIGRITGNSSNYQLIDSTYKKINREKRKERPNRQYIAGLRQQIDSLLLLPEIINVKVDDKKAYKHICKYGFICNGEKYVRLLCSAGMGRRSTVSFCMEKIYPALDEILRCGLVINEINLAKYNAYYGLYMSGIYDVRTPRFVVIPDCEISIEENQVDFIVDDKKQTPSGEIVDYRKIEKRDFVFQANVFDGAGLLSPEMAYKWACDLELDYIPSNFIIRSAFIKGMVAVFDFKQFARVYCTTDNTGHYKITDCYGAEHDLDNIDLILTQSQFKMWKYYNSLQEYIDFSKLYQHRWGVSKFPKKADKEYSLLNYQYIQTLNLDDAGINELTRYTEDWLYKICSGDELYTKLFAYGVGKETESIDDALARTDLGFLKALCIDFDLFQDDYIRRKIYQLAEKKIDEAKIGRLWVRGNYQTMIPDPFALAQHAFRLKVTGLLPKNCHYSEFWVERNVNKIDCMRSPMVDCSEHKVSNIIHNDKIDYWYQYLYSGIVMNIWGLDTIVHSDSDFDGDIIFSTDNKTVIDNIYPDRLPITYNKESAPAQRLNVTNMIKTDLATFDCKIGQTTNYSTRFFSMLCNYEPESREYKELVERIKLLRRYIGDSIDAGKGVKTKPFPAEWKSWKRVPDDWSEEQKKEQWFLNNLVEKRKPYFFIYIYNTTMDEYKKAKRKLDEECRDIFRVNFNELKSKPEKTQEEKNFVKRYYNELPVTKTPCIMNEIAWKIEDLEFDYKYPKNTESENVTLAKKLMCGDYKLMKSKKEAIKSVYNEWKAQVVNRNRKEYKKLFQPVLTISEKNNVNQSEANESVIDFDREIFGRKLEQIIANDKELADYLVQMAYIDSHDGKMKPFCWIFGYEGIVRNLLDRQYKITVPVKSNNGTMYLGEKYSLGELTE